MRTGLLLMVLLVGCVGPDRSATAPAAIEVETLVQSSASWDGEALPAYPDGVPEVTVLRITIPAGVALPEHRHPVINAGVLLEGAIEVTTEDGDAVTIRAGDGLIEVVDEWHAGRNPGPGSAVIVVVYAGVEGMPVSVKRER